ncbi:uncharacterized protein [Physcomitrium patens]|uniref:uncharacterized protein n=1 Tax=Physcomitrium patens TaxID=3218 RepID=UPI003CCDCFB0
MGLMGYVPRGKQTAHFFLALLENATSLSRNLEDIVVNREHRLECTQQRPYVLIITISNDFGTSVTLALSVIVISLRFLVKVIRMIEIEEVSQPNELYRVLARFTFHLLCPL